MKNKEKLNRKFIYKEYRKKEKKIEWRKMECKDPDAHPHL
jgi:hypothetical protein